MRSAIVAQLEKALRDPFEGFVPGGAAELAVGIALLTRDPNHRGGDSSRVVGNRSHHLGFHAELTRLDRISAETAKGDGATVADLDVDATQGVTELARAAYGGVWL